MEGNGRIKTAIRAFQVASHMSIIDLPPTCDDFVVILSVFGFVDSGELSLAKKVNLLISFRPVSLRGRRRHGNLSPRGPRLTVC